MVIYILKKEKGKKYESKEICKQFFGFDLQYEGKKPLGCSISDTLNYWAVAFGTQCGLDIEEKGRVLKKADITRHLHPKEREYLSGLSVGSSEWTEEFFRIWNAKEAIYKATGLNFSKASCLTDQLEYKATLDVGKDVFYFHYFEEKGLWGCLLTDEEGPLEIEYIKYAGKHAKDPMDYAMDLLAVRAYGSQELKKKLKTKGYSEEVSEQTVSRLLELGYLNDEDYAKRYVQRLLEGGKGREYIKQKLMQLGLNSVDLPEIDKDAEYEAALAIGKGLYERLEDAEAQQKLNAKIARRLASRGYPASLVYRVLSDLKREE